MLLTDSFQVSKTGIVKSEFNHDTRSYEVAAKQDEDDNLVSVASPFSVSAPTLLQNSNGTYEFVCVTVSRSETLRRVVR